MISHKAQQVFVVVCFIAIIALIAYPVIRDKNSLTAVPAELMHLKIDRTDGKKDNINDPEPQIIPPVLTENQN